MYIYVYIYIIHTYTFVCMRVKPQARNPKPKIVMSLLLGSSVGPNLGLVEDYAGWDLA